MHLFVSLMISFLHHYQTFRQRLILTACFIPSPPELACILNIVHADCTLVPFLDVLVNYNTQFPPVFLHPAYSVFLFLLLYLLVLCYCTLLALPSYLLQQGRVVIMVNSRCKDERLAPCVVGVYKLFLKLVPDNIYYIMHHCTISDGILW